jgi:hypothetical protein
MSLTQEFSPCVGWAEHAKPNIFPIFCWVCGLRLEKSPFLNPTYKIAIPPLSQWRWARPHYTHVIFLDLHGLSIQAVI